MKSQSFGYKNAWFACRIDSSQKAASALGLKDVTSSSWEEGINASYAHEERSNVGNIFITPPIDGWVLAVGRALWTLNDSHPPRVLEWCAKLSQMFGGAEVQYFSTYRVVEAHAWGRAKDGVATRSYILIDGEAHEDFGGQSEEEKALGFNFFDFGSPEADDESYGEREDLELPGEDHVMRLAASWSVNPSELEQREEEVELGILGRISLPEPNCLTRPNIPETPARPGVQEEVPWHENLKTNGAPEPPRRPWWRFW